MLYLNLPGIHQVLNRNVGDPRWISTRHDLPTMSALFHMGNFTPLLHYSSSGSKFIQKQLKPSSQKINQLHNTKFQLIYKGGLQISTCLIYPELTLQPPMTGMGTSSPCGERVKGVTEIA